MKYAYQYDGDLPNVKNFKANHNHIMHWPRNWSDNTTDIERSRIDKLQQLMVCFYNAQIFNSIRLLNKYGISANSSKCWAMRPDLVTTTVMAWVFT